MGDFQSTKTEILYITHFQAQKWMVFADGLTGYNTPISSNAINDVENQI